jgi:2-oxopent-4-enoate/cis-2-oxohex-4-enoate hydratase
VQNNKVFINPKSGSIRVTGTVEIVDSEGNLIERIENPKFCGCGLSKDKPWCDSSHKVITQPLQSLIKAQETCQEVVPFAPAKEIAIQIRERLVQLRVAAHESVVGLKIGGALESPENPNGVMIFGYLTDAMKVDNSFNSQAYIYPRAEAEVVFKISKDISAPIRVNEVLDYVSHVAVGMEIFDYRYGQAQIYSNDAIADNAGAAGFAHGEWIAATKNIFDGLTTSVTCNSEVIESADLSAIRGNPWEAIVLLSQLATAQGVILKKDWIIFSGSATKGVLLTAGNTFAVSTPGLGQVAIETQ